MRFAHYTICKEDESLICRTWMAGSTTFQDTLRLWYCQQRGEYYSVLFVCISICNRVLIAVRDGDWNSRALELFPLWSLLKLVWTWTLSLNWTSSQFHTIPLTTSPARVLVLHSTLRYHDSQQLTERNPNEIMI